MTLIIILISVVLFLVIRDIYTKLSNLDANQKILAEKISGKHVVVQAEDKQAKDFEDQQESIQKEINEPKIVSQENISVEAKFHVDKPYVPTGLEIYTQSFFSWFKIDWPMKVGGLILLLGIGWFLTYAIANEWISPAMRIGLGVVCSFGLMGGGWFKMRSQSVQSAFLVGLGAAVYVTSIFLGFKFFGFFGSIGSLGLVFLQYLFLLFLSTKYKNHRLSDVGLFFGTITPFLFSTGSHNIFGLFSYFGVHLLGNIIITFINQRSMSRLVGLIYLVLYVLILWVSKESGLSNMPVIIILSVLFLGVASTEIFHYISSKKHDDIVSLITLLFSGFISFLYIQGTLFATFGSTVSLSTINVLLGGFFLIYGTIWFLFASSIDKQNAYTVSLGLLGLLFLGGLAYTNFSGNNLLILTIILVTVVNVFVLIASRHKPSFIFTSCLYIIPLLMFLIFGFGPDSLLYNIAWYILSGGSLAVLFTYNYVFPHDSTAMEFRISYFVGFVAALVIGLCVMFDGYQRIIILEGVLAVLLLSLHVLDKKFVFSAIVSFFLTIPLLFILSQALIVNYSLFGLTIGILAIAYGIKYLISLSSSLSSEDNSLVSVVRVFSHILSVGMLYLSVIYLVQAEYYTLIYTIFGMIFVVFGDRIMFHEKSSITIKQNFLWLMIIPLLTSFNVVLGTHYVLDSVSLMLLCMSIFYLKFKIFPTLENKVLPYVFYALGLLYLFAVVRLSVFHFAEANTAIAIILILFTLIGVLLYVLSKKQSDKEKLYVGTAIIIVVIGRVLLVEIRSMSLGMKIITCLVMGAMLVATGFIANKKLHKDSEIGDTHDIEGEEYKSKSGGENGDLIYGVKDIENINLTKGEDKIVEVILETNDIGKTVEYEGHKLHLRQDSKIGDTYVVEGEGYKSNSGGKNGDLIYIVKDIE